MAGRPKSVMRQLLEELIAGAPKLEVRSKGLCVYLATITPALAARIVDNCNVDNRKTRQGKVAEFARYMERGDWMVKGTLEFLESGRIHDGQHRLKAVVAAGVPASFLVQILPDKDSSQASQFTDIGVPRNLADYLHFQGVEDANRIASFLVYERNYTVCGNPFQVSPTERKNFLARYHELGADRIKTALSIVPSNLHRAIGVQRALLDWFAFQVWRIDPEAAALFLSYVHEPEGLRADSPMFVANQKLKELAGRKKQRAGSVSLVEQAAVIVKAWNLHYEGKKADSVKLRYRVVDEWPAIKGEM